MKVAKHKASGRWFVRVPARMSDSGKRESRYFDTKEKASKFITDFKEEKIEHGKQAVTSDDRATVAILRRELGSDYQTLLPDILRHWKLTGEKLNQIEVKDAVKEFLNSAAKDYPNRRTLNDIRERMESFKAVFTSRLVHEVTPTDIERFLEGYSAGWDRWSYHKRLGPFFKLAKRRRWVAVNPMEEVPKPKTPTPERETYTVDQFSALLHHAELHDEFHPILPYIVMCGFCFLRTAELVRKFSGEEVLRWEHILWSESLIHVPPGVAKSTGRESGDERLIPLPDVAKAWLDPLRKPYDDSRKPKPTDDVVPYGITKFTRQWRALTDAVKVPRIDNGLRHSAISYGLAAHPEQGVALTSQWAGNSEKTIRKHYRQLLKPDQGKAWFAIGGGTWFNPQD
jgi:integrase